MQRLLAAVFAVACVTGVIGSPPAFARGPAAGMAHGSGAGMAHRSGARIGGGAALPQVPAMQNRIPAQLAAPAQPPVINGPLEQSPSGLPPMGGAR